MSHHDIYELNPDDPESRRILRNRRQRIARWRRAGWLHLTPEDAAALRRDDAATAARLLGSACYEAREDEGGDLWIRRLRT